MPRPQSSRRSCKVLKVCRNSTGPRRHSSPNKSRPPCEQPVVYPPKDVWELLTERRKKFDRVSLGKSNEAETKILEELDKRTELQYLDTQLGDVVNDLELRHHINVELDTTALTADGKGS